MVVPPFDCRRQAYAAELRFGKHDTRGAERLAPPLEPRPTRTGITPHTATVTVDVAL